MAHYAKSTKWHIDKNNAEGIEIIDLNDGHLVHIEDWGCIPTERGASFAEQVVQQARSDAYLIAVAPEMYDALENLLREVAKWRLTGKPDFDAILKAVRNGEAAISNAGPRESSAPTQRATFEGFEVRETSSAYCGLIPPTAVFGKVSIASIPKP